MPSTPSEIRKAIRKLTKERGKDSKAQIEAYKAYAYALQKEEARAECERDAFTAALWRGDFALEAAARRLKDEEQDGAVAEAHKPRPDRLTVDAIANVATLDGNHYPLTEKRAAVLAAIVGKRGGWCAGPDVKAKRPDRVVASLPAPIKHLIVSERGKGYRLNLA